MAFLTKFFGDPNERTIKRLRKIVEGVNTLEQRVEQFSDAKIKEQTQTLRTELGRGVSLDDILPEAFASVREAAKRTLGQRAFDTQIMGGIVLHEGKIAEMKTGEGKTLSATFPVYLNALGGKGAHVVTVNDYLARRDAVWMGQVYYALGMSVGCINHDQAFLYDPAYKVEKKDEEEARDEERDEMAEEEKTLHDVVWVPKDAVAAFVAGDEDSG